MAKPEQKVNTEASKNFKELKESISEKNFDDDS